MPRFLESLTIPSRQAFRHGKNRKGRWHMAKTIASGVKSMHNSR